jgi:hypothetical protein
MHRCAGQQRRPGRAAEDQEGGGGRVHPCPARSCGCAAPAASQLVPRQRARRTIVRGVGASPPRYQRPCRCPSTASPMPPSAPAPAGPSIAARGAAPAGRGASVVRSSAAAAGRKAPYGLAAGAQAAAAHSRATLPTARTAGTSSATDLRHGPAFPLPEANNIVTPSKASRHPRIRGPKPSGRVHLAGASACPRHPRISIRFRHTPEDYPVRTHCRRHLGRAAPPSERVAGDTDHPGNPRCNTHACRNAARCDRSRAGPPGHRA